MIDRGASTRHRREYVVPTAGFTQRAMIDHSIRCHGRFSHGCPDTRGGMGRLGMGRPPPPERDGAVWEGRWCQCSAAQRDRQWYFGPIDWGGKARDWA